MTVPVNRWLISRGKGHAVMHSIHSSAGAASEAHARDTGVPTHAEHGARARRHALFSSLLIGFHSDSCGGGDAAQNQIPVGP